jgi:hypothetical protein
MNALLTTIALWLSLNFDLPANYDHPTVEFASPAQIAAKRYPGLPQDHAGAGQTHHRSWSVVAVYDMRKRTIYLPQSWTGQTPAESSILVHEMVHHLQNAAGLKFACPEERERMAYEAQDKWLRLMGRSLQQDFEVDRFTLLVVSACMPR